MSFDYLCDVIAATKAHALPAGSFRDVCPQFSVNDDPCYRDSGYPWNAHVQAYHLQAIINRTQALIQLATKSPPPISYLILIALLKTQSALKPLKNRFCMMHVLSGVN